MFISVLYRIAVKFWGYKQHSVLPIRLRGDIGVSISSTISIRLNKDGYDEMVFERGYLDTGEVCHFFLIKYTVRRGGDRIGQKREDRTMFTLGVSMCGYHSFRDYKVENN